VVEPQFEKFIRVNNHVKGAVVSAAMLQFIKGRTFINMVDLAPVLRKAGGRSCTEPTSLKIILDSHTCGPTKDTYLDYNSTPIMQARQPTKPKETKHVLVIIKIIAGKKENSLEGKKWSF
jgi:hypothetical protein